MGTIDAKQDYRIIDELNTDWDDLKAGRQDEVLRWAAAHPALARCRDLGSVLAAVRDDADAVLSALLAENSEGSELAGRVVLQAMLGKVVKMASRDAQGTASDYVVALWCRIRNYPRQERPVKIAANLALDALKAVQHEHAWSRRGIAVALTQEEVVLDQLQTDAHARAQLDHGAEYGALTAASVITAAGRLGLIDSPTRQVLLSVYADGLSGCAAADRHGTSPGMIRYRCSSAVRRLAQHSASLAAAA